MTLAPLHDDRIRGVEGKALPLETQCAKPGCNRFSQERHHLWSKSWLRGQPIEFVVLPSGAVISNSVGVCTPHHGHLTGEIGGHKAKIVLEGDTLYWYDRQNKEEWKLIGPLWGTADFPVLESERCPTCGHVKHESTPRPKRKAKTWNVTVPDDEEDGADVLDSYVEDFAGIFGFSDESARLRRYHVLARVLQWASVNRIDLIREWEEAL